MQMPVFETQLQSDLRRHGGCQMSYDAAEEIGRLLAENARLKEALVEAEACMSIVEPRSDKAEYLRILGVVRAALAQT